MSNAFYGPMMAGIGGPGIPQTIAAQLARRRQTFAVPGRNVSSGMPNMSMLQNAVAFNHMRQFFPGTFARPMFANLVNPDHIAPGILQHLGVLAGSNPAGIPIPAPPQQAGGFTLPAPAQMHAQNLSQLPPGSPFAPGSNFTPIETYPGPGTQTAQTIGPMLGNDAHIAALGAAIRNILGLGSVGAPGVTPLPTPGHMVAS